MEIEEWFNKELAPHGFSLSQTLYNPHNFTPIRSIFYDLPTLGNRYKTVKIRTWINLEMFWDACRYGIDSFTDEIKQQITEEFELGYSRGINGYLCPWSKTFTPKKRLTKFKFTYY